MIHLYDLSDEDLLTELETALDDSTDGSSRNLNDFEQDFVESVMKRDFLTDKQRDVIISIIKKL